MHRIPICSCSANGDRKEPDKALSGLQKGEMTVGDLYIVCEYKLDCHFYSFKSWSGTSKFYQGGRYK